MRRGIAVVALCALVGGCRTARSAGEETPLTALTSASAAAAARQLAARRAQLTTERSLLRIRATNGDRSQSFRAQLQVDGSGRMLLTAYTPFGTNAMRLYAAGDEVTFVNDFEGTWWRGSVAEFARSFGFFGSASPTVMALLIAGLPAEGNGFEYAYAPAGLARASVGDVVVTFEPPSYPPQHITVVRAEQTLDIETLESAMTAAVIVPPAIPANYRCCVAPRM
ncbi:MAG: hypothetical protein M3P29_02390 [Acidobacteriota bacterium]|nr:hypothetical protein [Acidobacteriota bacterium]